MADNQVDPSGNTEAFRAFTRTTPPEAEAPSKTPFVIGGVVAVVVVVIALLAWLAL